MGLFRISLLFVLPFALVTGQAQTKDLPLSSGSCIRLGAWLYAYGIGGDQRHPKLCVYRLDQKLQVSDSLVFPQKGERADYLRSWADTLHGYLNIYLQRKERKEVSIFRLSNTFTLSSATEKVDVARLNSVSGFDHLFYSRNAVYSLRSEPDSGGRQFYLNKHQLKSESGNFEYTPVWQLPLQRRNIRSIRVLYADARQVLLYAALSGENGGQWLLKVSAGKGELLRGIHLNERNEKANCMPGALLVDTVQKHIWVAGQKITPAQWKEGQPRPGLANAAHALVYLVGIDSLNEVDSRDELKIPLLDSKSGIEKRPGAFVLRCAHLRKASDGRLLLDAELYRSRDGLNSSLYINSTELAITVSDEEVTIEKQTLAPNAQIESFYASRDPLDMNGKLVYDTAAAVEQLYWNGPVLPVVLGFKRSDDGNMAWLLNKTSAKTNTVTYARLAPAGKTYQVSVIDELAKTSLPDFLVTPQRFFIGYQADEQLYRLRSDSW